MTCSVNFSALDGGDDSKGSSRLHREVSRVESSLTDQHVSIISIDNEERKEVVLSQGSA